MSLPLLQPGNVIIQSWMTERDKLMAAGKPIDYICRFVADHLERVGVENRILMLKSYTGSGKSMIPVYLYKQFGSSGTVVMTEPRILTTVEITNGISRFSDLKMDVNLGYRTGPSKKGANSGVIISTTGVLVQQFKTLSDKDICKRYKAIVIDECHERDVDSDMLKYYIKHFLERVGGESYCPFIVFMSATFDQKLFMDYFSIPRQNYIEVKGQTFPIEEHWPEFTVSDPVSYLEKLMPTILLLDGDTIVFVQTTSMITKVRDMIEKKFKNKCVTAILDRTTYLEGGEEYQRFASPSEKTKIIIATAFAEVGVTIENLKCCVDFGMFLNVVFDSINNARRFVSSVVSSDMAIQRRGRVGRKSEGIWYPCYTKEQFEKFNATKSPDIHKSEYSAVLLATMINEMAAEIDSDNGIKFVNTDYQFHPTTMATPSFDSIEHAYEKLTQLGFLVNGIPTRLGILANRFPKLQLEAVRMILAGYYWDCNIKDLITIACFVSNGWTTICKTSMQSTYRPRNPLSIKGGKGDQIFGSTGYNKEIGEKLLKQNAPYVEIIESNKSAAEVRAKSDKKEKEKDNEKDKGKKMENKLSSIILGSGDFSETYEIDDQNELMLFNNRPFVIRRYIYKGKVFEHGRIFTARDMGDKPSFRSTPFNIYYPYNLRNQEIDMIELERRLLNSISECIGELSDYMVVAMDFMITVGLVPLLVGKHTQFMDLSCVIPHESDWVKFSYEMYKFLIETLDMPVVSLSDLEQRDLAYKFLWADEFLECLWIYYELLKVDPLDVESWCEENGFIYHGICSVLALRDEIIEFMLENKMTVVLDNYDLTELMKINLQSGMEEIAKIKKCIYDGYRCNLAVWNGRKYFSAWKKKEINNISSPLVSVKLGDHEQRHPKYIIANYYMINYIDGEEFFRPDLITVLDGFVDPDDQIFTTF